MVLMNVFIAIFLVAFFVFIFDRSCLWLEKKGLLYYRHKKPKKGVVGSALQELNAILLPSHRHALIAKEKTVRCKQNRAAGSKTKGDKTLTED